MNCSHPDCLTAHWVRAMTNAPMALEPEASEMLAFGNAIQAGQITVVECLRDAGPPESVTAALERISGKGRPQAPSSSSPNRRFVGCLHPPKR